MSDETLRQLRDPGDSGYDCAPHSDVTHALVLAKCCVTLMRGLRRGRGRCTRCLGVATRGRGELHVREGRRCDDRAPITCELADIVCFRLRLRNKIFCLPLYFRCFLHEICAFVLYFLHQTATQTRIRRRIRIRQAPTMIPARGDTTKSGSVSS